MLNKEEFEFLGITRWHELGYKGQGVTIASLETIVKGSFADVFCLMYGEKGNDYDEHGTIVMDYIRQVAPEAKKISAKSYDSVVKGEFQSAAMDFLLSNVPDFLGTANHGGLIDKDITKPYYKELHKKGCYLLCSAGNSDRDTLQPLTKGDLWKAVGACTYSKGNPKVARDYPDGEEMDFVSLHNLKATYDETYHRGTSFSYPVLMAMLALVQCFFIKKTGKKLTNEQLNKFAIDNCMDLEEEGHDIKTGHGLFILPDPEKIDIKKYVEDYMEKKIVLKIGNNIAEVNGESIELDCAPVIMNNRTLVPLRFISEELGCNVTWDEEHREVVIEK